MSAFFKEKALRSSGATVNQHNTIQTQQKRLKKTNDKPSEQKKSRPRVTHTHFTRGTFNKRSQTTSTQRKEYAHKSKSRQRTTREHSQRPCGRPFAFAAAQCGWCLACRPVVRRRTDRGHQWARRQQGRPRESAQPGPHALFAA